MEHKAISISLLDGHKRNYRSHPEGQLKKLTASLERFQQVRSIVVAPNSDGRYTVLAGHGVVEAAKLRGISEIKCDIVPKEWDQATRDAYLIADNLHSQDATDDQEVLAALLQEQQDEGFDLASLGADDEYLRQLLETLGDEYAGVNEGEDEDLLDISDEGRQTETIMRLKFGKYEVPLTQDEYEDLERKLKRYSDDTGSYHGFARTLL